MDGPTVETPRAAFVRAARAAPPGTRVPVEVRVDVDDPYRCYRRVRRGEWGFYLATASGSGWGYFGTAPVDTLTVPFDEPGAIERLAERAADERLARAGCEVPYPCGSVGWLSYDVARDLEDLPSTTVADRRLPRLQFGVYDRLAAWEEPRPEEGPVTLRVTACPRVGDPDPGEDPGVSYDRARERALDLARAATEGDPGVEAPAVEGADADPVQFESECGREAFRERVRAVKRRIRAGETFQANLSHRLTAPATVHPVGVFDALRRVNPAPYMALLECPGVDLVGASPELLLERDGRRLLTEPIAGTRPRGETPAADAALERELRADEKERAEHAMLVDLERNDLGEVSEYGSVAVEEYRRVDRYAEVMHLVSRVTGRLRPDCSFADALRGVFPGGTITGAPKPRTMAIVDECEGTRRGPYTGSVGIVGFDERATLNIVIRTLVRHADTYALRVGAGVVHDSDPDREYEETLAKARGTVAAVDAALETGGMAVNDP